MDNRCNDTSDNNNGTSNTPKKRKATEPGGNHSKRSRGDQESHVRQNINHEIPPRNLRTLQKAQTITLRNMPIPAIFQNIILYVIDFLTVTDRKSILYVNKRINELYWKSISTLIAKTPHEMDIMKTVLKKIMLEHPQQLLKLKNVGWWSEPGRVSFPIDKEIMEILHMCPNIVRLILGKGQRVLNVSKENFQLLRSLNHLELIEMDHTDLDSTTFTEPIPNTNCGNKYCTHCPNNTEKRSLLEYWKNIKSFRVRGVECKVNDPILLYLSKSENLKRVGIWGSGIISDSDITHLDKLKDVRELILSSCTSSGNRNVFKVLSKMNLHHIGLFYAQNNNSDQDEDFKVLAEIPSLTSLHIGGWNLTNKAFQGFYKNYNLMNMSISRAQAISREGINFIAQNTGITTLRISACIFLRDFDLVPVLSMPQLRRLDLDNTKSITDNFLQVLVDARETCKIEELYLMGIPLISNKGLLSLAKFGSLKTLVIKNCQYITERAPNGLRVTHVSDHTEKLKVMLDNTEYRKKQQEMYLGTQNTSPNVSRSHEELLFDLEATQKQTEIQLKKIRDQQPNQPEPTLQTAYEFQAELQQIHNLLYTQQSLEQQIERCIKDSNGNQCQ